MKSLKELMESIIIKMCNLYFNHYDLLVQCETDENNDLIVLFNDYEIEEELQGE